MIFKNISLSPSERTNKNVKEMMDEIKKILQEQLFLIQKQK